MKAAVYGRSGVEIEEIEKPTPSDDEVLVKVRAASINAPDWRLMSASPPVRRLLFAITKAKVARPGSDIAGVVETVGKNVTLFKPGDAVFGSRHRLRGFVASEPWIVNLARLDHYFGKGIWAPTDQCACILGPRPSVLCCANDLRKIAQPLNFGKVRSIVAFHVGQIQFCSPFDLTHAANIDRHGCFQINIERDSRHDT
jgi:hypothetical protein